MCEGDLKVVMLLDPELLPASFVFFCTPPPAFHFPLIRCGLYKPAAMAAVLVKLARKLGVLSVQWTSRVLLVCWEQQQKHSGGRIKLMSRSLILGRIYI